MAKGDSKRAQQQIDTQGSIMQAGMNNLNENLYGANNQFMNNYNQGVGMNLPDYSNMMGLYQNFLSDPFSNPVRSSGGSAGMAFPQGSQMQGQPNINFQDPGSIDQFISQMAQQQGVNPSVANDPGYWRGKIASGELGQDVNYIREKMMTPEGAPAGSFGGGALNPAVSNFYSQLMNNGGGFGWDPQFRGALGQAIGGYGNFAETGGFSPQDIQDLRARAISPTRATFSRAMENVNRQRALQGGYSPNYTAAMAKMARDLAYGISDANTNANAGIAQMVQQGKLAGLGGLTSAGLGGQGMENSITGGNLNARLAGAGGLTGLDQFNQSLAMQGRLGALGGMNSLYGTTPGLSQMFGNQVLQSQGNLINGQQLQNQLGLGMQGNQINKSAIPGDFSQAMGNIGSVVNLAGNIGGALMGVGAIPGFGGGRGSLPTPTTNFNPRMPGTSVPNWGRY